MKSAKALALVAALGLSAGSAFAAGSWSHVNQVRPDVFSVAQTAGTFETLLVAANNAGVLARLADPLHRVTLLAPTDEAFAKLPKGTIEYLMRADNKDKLAELVNNHIIAGGVLSTNFADQPIKAQTLAGQTVTLSGMKAGTAKIEHSDVIASNGVVHVIDQVLVPQK